MKKSPAKKKQFNIPSSLKSFLAEDEYKLYEEYFNTEATKALRKKLVEMFDKKVDTSYLKTDKEQKYETPSWSEYQADAIGYRRALRELIEFLK